MVKGVSRRIVVVRAPEQNIFEEAIFILRDDALKKGVSAEDVIAQACGIANRYIRENREGRAARSWIPAVCIAGGLVLGVLVWALLAWL
ncbi:MAG: translation initiation factor 2 [Eubacteriales bacterium]|nr:translation initiation factor 2 [Clostridiales bacterium]MDY3071466.1 translation initiation factor 2 [Eubacteriales bacterium]MDY3285587.1 translation initiation factor 2 [Eubacteriales bacterium]